MKNEGYTIVGYCRMSKTERDFSVCSLQGMVNDLFKRSLVDKVFVSPKGTPKQAFQKRDLADSSDILSKLEDVTGNTQDFLNFIKDNQKICVVAVDYDRLTTNMSDLKNLLR